MVSGANSVWKKLPAVLVAATLLSGCVTQAYSLGEAQLATRQAAEAAQASVPAGGSRANPSVKTVTFRLKTLQTAGRLAFMGIGGDLEGQVNPDLVVQPGDMVEIIVENGDGFAPHQITVEGYGATLPAVSQKGQEAHLTFKAEKVGIFLYSFAGDQDQAAGVQGRLIVGQPDAAQPAAKAHTAGMMDQGASADPQAGTVSFRLETGMADGKMSFIGRGGELEGQANPDLNVKPGDTVEIILVNGDGVLHNLSVPDFGAISPDATVKGQELRLTFKVDKEGIFSYFCAIPGHRQAGMEGRLIVGQPAEAQAPDLPGVARAADDLPAPLTYTAPQYVRVDLETVEVEARLADGASYTFWTFDGKVPGPFIRVRAGDTVEVHLKNAAGSSMAHSVDFHAVTGPGGGAVATQTQPGQETHFNFQALNPGLYVYHCATPMVAHHITNGMYGLILVEPEGGLPAVDREFYVMQSEIYTTEPYGQKGALTFSQEKLLDEHPEYLVFNGAVGALTTEHPLHAKVGETVRIFLGVGGPNITSSFHVIGEIFDRVYDQGSLTAPPLTDVQTTLVPSGGATVVEFQLQVPGRYILVDHALSRMERGLAGFLLVDGPDVPEVFDGKVTPGSGH